MNGLSEKTRDRLAKLIPLLGSDKQGEVLASVAAIRAALRAAGLDLHDLDATMAAAPIVATQKPAQIAPAPTWRELSHQERLGWLIVILAQDDLGSTERNKLSDLYSAEYVGRGFNLTKYRARLLDEQLARAFAKGMRP